MGTQIGGKSRSVCYDSVRFAPQIRSFYGQNADPGSGHSGKTSSHDERERIAEIVKQNRQEQASGAQTQPDRDKGWDCRQRHRDGIEGKAVVREATGMCQSEQEARQDRAPSPIDPRNRLLPVKA
jgi:hypothetical protein